MNITVWYTRVLTWKQRLRDLERRKKEREEAEARLKESRQKDLEREELIKKAKEGTYCFHIQ